MSAFVVGKAHVDALVRAGLAYGGPPGMYRVRWFWPPITQTDRDMVYVRGVAIPAGSVELAQARSHELTSDEADRVGAMLWAENVRSVAWRYDEDPLACDDLPGPADFGWADVAGYRYPVGRVALLEPVGVLKALDGLEYQSCEHPGWEGSEAFAFVETLRRRAVHALPGYEGAAWEVGH